MENICLLLTVLTLVCHSVAEQPTWPTSCSMSRYTGMYPRASDYSSFYHGSESLCREKCEGDSSCGMYRWKSSEGWCHLYHTSIELMTQVMGVDERVMMGSTFGSTFGSKKCEGVIYDHTHCPEYPKHYVGKYIDSKHRILWVHSYSTILSPSQCWHLCSTYTQCRSVRRYVYSSFTHCILYSTTITELVESGKEDEVLTESYSTTSERYCGEVPYDPSTTETTTPTETITPPLDCSNLSTLDGSSLCLPIGDADEAACQAIPGCCFVELGGLVPVTLCIKPH